MKILHVIPTVNPVAGGPVEGLKQLNSQYGNLGVVAEIACCDPPGSPWHSDSRLPHVHALGPSKGSYAYTPNLRGWLKKNAHNYDAVIINGLWQYNGRAVHSVLAGTNTPYFVFTHGMLDPWFKKTYPLKHLKKWLYWPWAEYRTLRDAKAVIFTSEEERLLARESFWLYRAKEAVTAYGTDAPPLDDGLSEAFLTKFPDLAGKRLVLFLSRIHEKKGCDLLLEAFARIASSDDSLHLVMAGPDQTGWKKELISQSERLRIAHKITWTGMLQGADKWGAYYAAEVFCLPSHQENFGIVVAEALACGTPVIISNKVNIWREVKTQNAGLVGDDTLMGTIDSLSKWLTLPPDERQAMNQQARNCFYEHFHIQRAAERLIEIITENK